jgi:hypothetical protein
MRALLSKLLKIIKGLSTGLQLIVAFADAFVQQINHGKTKINKGRHSIIDGK